MNCMRPCLKGKKKKPNNNNEKKSGLGIVVQAYCLSTQEAKVKNGEFKAKLSYVLRLSQRVKGGRLGEGKGGIQ